MSQRLIDIGTSAGAGDGDDLRTAFDKVNDNFTDIYSGNVTAANVLVTSVANRIGDVQLTWLDVAGVASLGNITQLKQFITANLATANSYTDAAVANLTTIPSVNITGGNITSVNTLSANSTTLGNLTVNYDTTIGRNLSVTGGAVIGGTLILTGGSLNVNTITFGDSTTLTTAPNFVATTNSINALRANVTAANARVDAANASISTTNANVTAANVAIGLLQSNAATQAIALSGLVTANSIQAGQISTLFANAGTQYGQIVSLQANIAAANALILTLSGGGVTISDVNAANAAIAAVQAGLTATNSTVVSHFITATSNAVAQSLAINGLRANITAANSAIVAANAYVRNYADVLVNAANVSAQANALSQGVAIRNLTDGQTAANITIASLLAGANLTVANIQISELRANITAANAAIAAVNAAWQANAAGQATSLTNLVANAASQAVYLNTLTANAVTQTNELTGLRANITAANAAIAAINIPSLAGNVTIGNVTAWHGNFEYVSGVAQTAAQPNITSLGTLTSANVTGNVTASSFLATGLGLYGTIRTPNQGLITTIGTLGTLNVTGNVVTGNVSGATGTFTNIRGAVLDATQTAITRVGTQTQLAVSGTTTLTGILDASLAPNIILANVFATSITAGVVKSANLSGVLSTAVQPNITSIGTLSTVTVTGNATVGNLVTSGVVFASGALLTNLDVNNVGYVAQLSAANVIVNGGIRAGNIVTTDYANVNQLIASTITGTIVTASQTNITTVGNLTNLRVLGTITTGNLITLQTLQADTFYGNVLATNVSVGGNILGGNVNVTNTIRTSGNLVGNNLLLAGNISSSGTGSYVHADLGDFALVNGVLNNALQPNITAVGTLTSLRVNGPVEITGSQFVAQDFYVTGNLFINGNTTTVSAGNVTTSDKDITLANGAVNSTAARGAGILIGEGGAYGNLTIYDGVWTTPNAFTIAGNVSTGNVSGATGTFTNLVGTLQTAAQPNITSVGTLGSLAVSGNITGTILGSQPYITALGGLTSLAVSGNATTGNVSGATGTFTNIRGALLDPSQTNITAVGTLGALTVTGNVATGNVSGTKGTFTDVAGTLLTNAQPNITSVGNLSTLNVTGTVTLGGLQVSGTGSLLSIGNLAVTDNITTANLSATGNVYFNNITGTLLTNAQPNITSVGTLTGIDATGNISTTGDVIGNIGYFNSIVFSGQAGGAGTISANVTGTYGNFTFVTGTLTTASQPNITTVGTLSTLTVTGNIDSGNITTTGTVVADSLVANVLNVDHGTVTANLSTGNISGATGTFTNVRGALLDASQTNITAVGTLGSLAVTGNVTTGNVSGTKGTFSEVQGTLLTNAQPNITSVGTLASLAVTGEITGNVTATLFTGGYLTQAFQPNITTVGTLGSLTVGGNINASGVDAQNARFTALQGNVLTNAQPYITSLGTLIDLTVTGNINTTVGNITSAQNITGVDITASNSIVANVVTVTGNVTAGNVNTGIVVASGNISSANLTTLQVSADKVIAPTVLTGNLYSTADVTAVANLTVTGSNIFAISANILTLTSYAQNAFVGTLVGTDTTDSSSALIGAITTAGGIGVAKTVYAGGNLITDSNVIAGGNVIVGTNVRIGGDMYFFGTQPSVDFISNRANVSLFDSSVTTISIGGEATTVNIGAISGFGNTTIQNDLTVKGGLYLTGGWGLTGTGNVTINNNVAAVSASFANTVYANTRAIIGLGFNGATPITSISPTTGALQVRGGAGVLGNLVIGTPNWSPAGNLYGVASPVGFNSNSNVYIRSTTPTISANTGALQVYGGISTTGNAWVAGDLTVQGTVNFTTFLAASVNNTPIGNNAPSTGVFTALALSLPKPAVSPAFNFDFVNGRRLPDALTYTRTGPGTYYDINGNLRVAPPHAPRYTYEPSTLFPLGIMIEESRQNLLRETNGLANASAWSTLNGSISSASTIRSPDGTFNAFKITDSALTGIHGLYVASAYQPTVSLGLVYTASAFVKSAEKNQVALIIPGAGSPSIFDLSLGTVAYEPTPYNSSIQTLANGWYRIQSTVSTVNTSGNVVLALADGGSETYLGTGSDGVYAYGLQLEPGAFATSYIPNTTIANTRGQDNLTVTATEFARKYDIDTSTVAVTSKLSYRPASLGTDNQRSTLISFSDGTVNNRVSIVAENKQSPANRYANLVIYSSGVAQANISISNAAVQSANLTSAIGDTLAVSFGGGRISRAYNGTANTYATSGNISSTISQINIGSGPGTSVLNGTIAKLQIWSAVSDLATIQGLSINTAQGVS
jgi:hypothetical protein